MRQGGAARQWRRTRPRPGEKALGEHVGRATETWREESGRVFDDFIERRGVLHVDDQRARYHLVEGVSLS